MNTVGKFSHGIAMIEEFKVLSDMENVKVIGLFFLGLGSVVFLVSISVFLCSRICRKISKKIKPE